ncbi:MAG TPA: cytochrome C oxidase subunit I [Burkholderiales bacterium]|nr:cytochrome C oxidase subunit I [Burkholderiales bacterium]
MSEEHRAGKGLLSLLFVGVVAIAPMIAAYTLYTFWRPTAFTNYGQLLPPTPVAGVSLGRTGGREFRLEALKGKWVFLIVDSGTCPELCRQRLYKMRQVRLTQGKDMDRIERAWLIDDDARPSGELLAEYPGMYVVRARESHLLSLLPAEASVRDHIYVVDPLGNLMMRYPRDADPSKMKNDIARLLKLSTTG